MGRQNHTGLEVNSGQCWHLSSPGPTVLVASGHRWQLVLTHKFLLDPPKTHPLCRSDAERGTIAVGGTTASSRGLAEEFLETFSQRTSTSRQVTRCFAPGRSGRQVGLERRSLSFEGEGLRASPRKAIRAMRGLLDSRNGR